MKNFIYSIKRNFFAGIIVSVPLFMTGYISWLLIKWFDNIFQPLVPFNIKIPGIGVVITFIIILFIGFVASNFLGKNILSLSEKLVKKMPFIRSIYIGSKQIVETIFSKDGTSFQLVGLIEYPRKEVYVIVFIAKESSQFMMNLVDNSLANVADKQHSFHLPSDEYYNVFLPTTPNPTSGYMLIVPKKDVSIVDISVEEALKLVISGGLITPDIKKKLTKKG